MKAVASVRSAANSIRSLAKLVVRMAYNGTAGPPITGKPNVGWAPLGLQRGRAAAVTVAPDTVIVEAARVISFVIVGIAGVMIMVDAGAAIVTRKGLLLVKVLSF